MIKKINLKLHIWFLTEIDTAFIYCNQSMITKKSYLVSIFLRLFPIWYPEHRFKSTRFSDNRDKEITQLSQFLWFVDHPLSLRTPYQDWSLGRKLQRIRTQKTLIRRTKHTIIRGEMSILLFNSNLSSFTSFRIETSRDWKYH